MYVCSSKIIEFIFDLFARRGAEAYLGESVSMSQHMEQTAACAVADGASDSLVVAALLHDIGHFVSDLPADAHEQALDNRHETAGAAFLSTHFPDEVTEPIRMHVLAKRYLCATDDNYSSCLSSASVLSLGLQGGPMNAAEIKQFESNPNYLDALQLRRYDDDGKLIGLKINPITAYREQLESLLIQ